ncbi:hypothetical protein ACRXCV_00405 (plasmid) [Halobacteriovorax sp. GFR7]|uniref:hypothetical protein n=1 Tax=unclassified Halobacteriovorax TaxID=2639665 RepID=UPI003D965F20
MSQQSKTILRKADLAVAEINGQGSLTIEQSNRFIRKLIEAPTLLRVCRTIAMSAPSRRINKIGFGERIMRAANQGTYTGGVAQDDRALAAADRSKPQFEKIELNTKEIMAEIRLPYELLEDNIEGGNINFGGATQVSGGAPNGGILNTILDLIAERAAIDMEELCLLGDTASGDAYLALVDGWLKRAQTANSLDYGNQGITRKLFKIGIQMLEPKYKRNMQSMRHFLSHNQVTEYSDTLAGRETQLGDSKHTQGTAPVYGNGVLCVPVALMPESQGILCDPKNLLFGIQRNLSLEIDKDIRAREFVVVLTARVDVQIEETEAVIHYNNILDPLA